MSNVFKKFTVFSVLLLAFFLTSCEDTTQSKQFDASAGNKNVLTVTNLSSINTYITIALSKDRAAATQSAPLQFNAPRKSAALRMDLEEASRFNANPPQALEEPSRSVLGPSFAVLPSEGATKKFYVQNASGAFIQIDTTLRKQGVYCNVWVDNSWFGTASGKINAAKAQEIANYFDRIYPLETNLLGYEYGGGTGGNGGKDGDPRIQILVYDIVDEGVLGFFWSKDYYTDGSSTLGSLRSNEAEIFYIDADLLLRMPKVVYSTLVHEFQHMINFNQKSRNGLGSEAWFDEMLAMLAEDIIDPLIGMGQGSGGHPIDVRIPDFLGYYPLCGVDQWLEGDDVIMSYSTAYAFGAYLIRNYGGPQLLYEMLHNDKGNRNSIDKALETVNPGKGFTFDKALERYAEALLYSTSNTGTVPADKMSFDRSRAYTIGSTTYTAAAFDIWKIKMDPDMLADYHDKNYITNALYYNYKGGPITFPLIKDQYPSPVPGHSVWLIRVEETGKITVNVTISPGYVTVIHDMVSY